MTRIILSSLLSLAASLLLLPLEQIFPYPHFIEEIVKLIIVGIIVDGERKLKKNFFLWVILSAILFTISESIFYLANIFAVGNLFLFPQRIILTGTLHLGTFLLLYLFAKKGKIWIGVGLIFSILIHYLYNLLVNSPL